MRIERIAGWVAVFWLAAPGPAGAVVCVPTPVGNCLCNGDFEDGTINCWTFTTNCNGAGCADQPCAVAVQPAPDNGCNTPGSCCCTWSPGVCPGLFNVVACGSYSAQIFSGEQAGGCQGNPNNFGQLAQTITLPPGGAVVSLWYAFSRESSFGWGEFAIDLAGSCGNTTVWSVVQNTCIPWTYTQANLCGYGGCLVTFRARAVSQGALCTWSYIDDVYCEPCVPPPSPTPTPTRTHTPTPTPAATFRMAVYAENGELVRDLVEKKTGPGPGFHLRVQPTYLFFPDENGSARVTIAYLDTWVTWDGSRADGTAVSPGTYFLRAWTYTEAGVIRQEVVPIFVVHRAWPVKLRIHTSAGELVRELEGRLVRDDFTAFELSPDPFSPGDHDPVASQARVVLLPGPFTPPLASGGDLAWDGRNSRGEFVENGTYFAQVEWLSYAGRRVHLSRPVTALVRNRDIIRSAAVAPNPVAGGGVTFSVTVAQPAAVSISVHDVAGRTVWTSEAPSARLAAAATAAADPLRRVVRWDLSDRTGARVPAGIYLAIARARTASGASAVRRLRLAVSHRVP